MQLRVVMIDDEAWTRDLLRRIGHWRELGYRIVGEAADGVSGLECIRQLHPHLIVTDMRMPGLDGSQLLRTLEQNDVRAKVIIVSGYYDYQYARQALKSHVADYLLKPINEDEFNERLRICAEELTAEEQKILPESILTEKIEPRWMKNYVVYREDLSRSFESSSQKGVVAALDKIEGLFLSLKEEDTKLKIMIKVNYDLQSLLEETMIARYGQNGGDMSVYDIPFTIRRESTIRDLARHYRKVTSTFLFTVAEQQSKKKIDISRICEYVRTHYSENVTLENTAKRFFVSKEYLSSAFKKETGATFTRYLISVRMEKAKEMILEYGIPIQRVAEMVGYTDIAYFYRTFKRFFGTTPAKLSDESK